MRLTPLRPPHGRAEGEESEVWLLPPGLVSPASLPALGEHTTRIAKLLLTYSPLILVFPIYSLAFSLSSPVPVHQQFPPSHFVVLMGWHSGADGRLADQLGKATPPAGAG